MKKRITALLGLPFSALNTGIVANASFYKNDDLGRFDPNEEYLIVPQKSYTVRAVFNPFDEVPSDMKVTVKLELECTNDVGGWNSDILPIELVDSAGVKHYWETNRNHLDDEHKKVNHEFDLGAVTLRCSTRSQLCRAVPHPTTERKKRQTAAKQLKTKSRSGKTWVERPRKARYPPCMRTLPLQRKTSMTRTMRISQRSSSNTYAPSAIPIPKQSAVLTLTARPWTIQKIITL